MKLELGINLKRLRVERELTQEKLSCCLGLSVQQISRYETGAAYPDIEMLPVIAGFFEITVDELLGTSKELQIMRKNKYATLLRESSDPYKKLEILKLYHSEFPDDWSMVPNMINTLRLIPENLDEMRSIAHDAMKSCNDPGARSAVFNAYLYSEPDDSVFLTFVDKWAIRDDLRKTTLLKKRYMHQNNNELQRILQMELASNIHSSLISLTSGKECDLEVIKNCTAALEFLDALTGEKDRALPDMWISLRAYILLRLSDSCFLSGDSERGYLNLDTAVRLFENLDALPDSSPISYKSKKLELLDAKKYKRRLTDPITLADDGFCYCFDYNNPIAHWDTSENELLNTIPVHLDMEYRCLKLGEYINTNDWQGFEKVKNEEKYQRYVKRIDILMSNF